MGLQNRPEGGGGPDEAEVTSNYLCVCSSFAAFDSILTIDSLTVSKRGPDLLGRECCAFFGRLRMAAMSGSAMGKSSRVMSNQLSSSSQRCCVDPPARCALIHQGVRWVPSPQALA